MDDRAQLQAPAEECLSASASLPSSGSAGVASATSSTTMTMTEAAAVAVAPPQESQDEVLTLTLRARPSVRWEEDVLDNEGMGRKSSKRCCIFHKQRAFGESSTDSSDYDSDKSGSSAASGGDDGDKKPRAKKNGKIARPKKDKKVPDFQRHHA